MESVTLHNVTSIPDSCFYKCLSLKTVTLNDGIKSIGANAFSGCSAISSITLKNSIETIGTKAFYECTGLLAVHINDISVMINMEFTDEYSNPLYYANDLYMNGEKLTEMQIPYGSMPIPPFAFVNLSVTTLFIPEDVLIDATSFQGCANIKKLSAHADNIQYIPLSEVDELNIIAGEAFAASSVRTDVTIKKLTLADSIKNVYGSALTARSTVEELHIYSSEVCFYGTRFTVSKIYVPTDDSWHNMTFETQYSNPIRGAELYSLEGHIVKDLYIPKSITNIADRAFRECKSIKSVYIESADTVIGTDAFANIELEELNIHTSQLDAFSTSKSSLKNLEILSGESIPAFAFANITTLESVSLCDSLTTIGQGAFKGCTSLKLIQIPGNTTDIDSGAFSSCSALEQIDFLGTSLVNIGERAFEYCTALTSITIPEGVTTIGSSAFQNCSSLEIVFIPHTVAALSGYEFYDCDAIKHITCSTEHLTCKNYPALETVEFIGGTTICDSLFSSAPNLCSIILPDTLTTIGAEAFKNCEKLLTISFPGTLESIGKDAFYGCTSIGSVHADSLSSWLAIGFSSEYSNPLAYATVLSLGENTCRELTVPEDISYINSYAFYGYGALESVTLHGDMYIGNNAFSGCESIKRVNIATLEDWLSIWFYAETSNPIYYAGELYIGEELLVDLVIPDGVESIRSYAFAGIESIKTIYIPSTVTNFNYSAFSSASGIQELQYCMEYCSAIGTFKSWFPDATVTAHQYNYVLSEESHYQVCSICANETTPTPHTWSRDPIEKLAPTHKEEGYAIYSCECGQTTKKILEVEPHYYYNSEYIEPTHTQEGGYIYTCDCGESFIEPIEKLTQHTWDNGSITTEPTHMTPGVLTYTCECGDTYTEEIPVLYEHEYGQWQEMDDVYHVKTCECGYSYTQYHIFDNALDGTCDDCGYTRVVATESETEKITPTETEEIITAQPQETETEEFHTERITSAPNVNKSGCGSTLGATGIVIFSACAVSFLFRKRKDEE